MSRLDKRPSSLVLSAADEGSITREGPLIEGPTMWWEAGLRSTLAYHAWTAGRVAYPAGGVRVSG